MPSPVPIALAHALLLVLALHPGTGASAAPAAGVPPALRVVSGVADDGRATTQWLAMLRRRLDDERYRDAAAIRRALTGQDSAWAALIRSRAAAWEGEIAALAVPFQPAAPPPLATIVLGNRGASDAFVHDAATVGFDLAALQAAYGDADAPENRERIDRLFRHEYVHLLQQGWLTRRPYAADTPLRAALAEIWAEGLGNHQSLSARWRSVAGRPSATAAAALARLEPRFVARLAALACAPPGHAAALSADLSWGRFDEKWGALPAALWLELEQARGDGALRAFIEAGPDGVWTLAGRHLSPPLRAALGEARAAAERCGAP